MKAYFEILRKDEVRFREGQLTMPWHEQPEGTAAEKAAIEYAQAALLYRWNAMVIGGNFHCGNESVPLEINSICLTAKVPGGLVDFAPALRGVPEYDEAAEAAETVRIKKLLKRLRPGDF